MIIALDERRGNSNVPVSARVMSDGMLRFLAFATALLEADLAVVTDILGAREDPRPGVTGKLVVDAILRQNPRAPVVYLPRLNSVPGFLDQHTRPGDLVLTMGCGNINLLNDQMNAHARRTQTTRRLTALPGRKSESSLCP